MKINIHSRLAVLVCGTLALVALLGSNATPAAADGGIIRNAYAHVTNTDGDKINLRGGAGGDYDVKDKLDEGTVLWVLEGPVKDDAGVRWYRVDRDGHVGWINADYLAGGKGDGSGSAPAVVPSKPAVQASASLKVGTWAAVANTDGDALRVRKSASPDAAKVAAIDPDTVVNILKGPTKDSEGTTWYQVQSGDTTGWVMARYLQAAAKPKAPAVVSKPKTTTPASAANPPAARSGTARGSSAAPAPPPAVSPNAAGVVQTALRYLGYRYVYGGTTPAGFDCSGFVYYVYNKAGIGFPRAMDSQIARGTAVKSTDLRPGDLVYFRNTYRQGISHIGIYIGNGKIVHAADYDTGVIISDLWSAYWAAHYAGAVRISR